MLYKMFISLMKDMFHEIKYRAHKAKISGHDNVVDFTEYYGSGGEA